MKANEELLCNRSYEIIRNELKAFNPELLERAEHIFLSKTDLVSREEVEQKLKKLKVLNKEVIPISVIDENSLEQVHKLLCEIIKQKSILRADDILDKK